MRFSTSVVGAVVGGVAAVSALNQIAVKDRHFIDSKTGEPFFVRGVDYQPGGSSGYDGKTDPLFDTKALARDIYIFQKLGINTIRVYSLNPLLNHDVGMTMLNDAGIYLVLDVNTPLDGEHLNDQVPWTTYNHGYAEHIFTVLEVFAGYDNLLGVLAGNEVVHQPGSEKFAPQYVKAVVRDIKNYMTKQMKRMIPVGYANADDIQFRIPMADYLQCGTDNENVDFFGVNSYQWCGPTATFESSGYNTLVDDFQNYSIPVFFTEYGCNKPAPRAFNEVTALYSDEMTGVFSGGLVYQYNQDVSDFGLVSIDSSTKAATWNTDLVTLQTKFSGLAAPKIPSNITQTVRPTTCDIEFPAINGTYSFPSTLPTVLPEIQTLIDGGVPGNGINWTAGAFVDASKILKKTPYSIFDANNKAVSDPTYNAAVTSAAGAGTGGTPASPTGSSSSGTSGNSTKKSAANTMGGNAGFSSLCSLLVVGVVGVMFL